MGSNMKLRWYIICDRTDRDDNPRAIMFSLHGELGGTGRRDSPNRALFNSKHAAEVALQRAAVIENQYCHNFRVVATRIGG